MKTQIALVLAIGLALTGFAMADLTGTGHDFSNDVWSGGEICKPCHTPHNADTTVTDAPLWDHELTVASYDMHSGPAVARDDALDGRSILCMSCHDGTVALDSFGGDTGVQFIGGSENFGTDMTDDHPVGSDAIYPSVPWMTDPAVWEGTAGSGFTLRDMDISGTVERVVSCTTCHEPHSRNGFANMLWVNNTGSALCLTCHLNK